MDIMEAIHTRRSIRKYLDKPVPEDLVKELVSAAMAAPSAGNAQPWHFMVISDRAILNRITEVHPYAGMLKTAPLAIAVCAETGLEKYPGYWPQDCSAATQNILLAARGLGLGSVWTGVHPDGPRHAAVSKALGVPEGVMVLNVIAVGYPDAEHKRVDRFKPERVHVNTW